MDPNPNTHPILSYVMARLPSLRLKPATPATSVSQIDIEQPPSQLPTDPSSSSGQVQVQIEDYMPHLAYPGVLASMTLAVTDVAQTRSVLQTLGPRPDHEAVDKARAKLAEIEANLGKQLEKIVLSPRPPDVDRLQWRAHLAERESECRQTAEKEKRDCKAVVQLDEMHDAYEKLLKEAEERLVKIYESAESSAEDAGTGDGQAVATEEVNEEVVESTIPLSAYG